MNIEREAYNLLKDKSVASIISKISSPSYKRLPIAAKKELFDDFNNILSRRFETYLNLFFADNPDDDNDIKIHYEDGALVLNRLDKNPYKYLEQLIAYHLAYYFTQNRDAILSIGNVSYNDIYFNEFPGISFYDKNNYKAKQISVDVVTKLIKGYQNEYKQEFDDSFEKNISLESQNIIVHANKILDEELKECEYSDLVAIDRKMTSMLNKDSSLNIEELALLSIKDFLIGYQDKATMMTDNTASNKYFFKIKKHLTQFIKYFFSEFSNEINIVVEDGDIYVDDTLICEDNLFIDVVMNKIAKIEDKKHIINSNLDSYFLSRLNLIDSLLKDKNLGVINYVSFAKMYNHKGNKDIYKDNYDMFENLFYDEEFLSLINDYLSSEDINTKILHQIVGMMNKTYDDAKIKLIINKDSKEFDEFGSSIEDTIHLNTTDNEKVNMLMTLFHEYRHCMQYIEAKDNHGIFNDEIYEYIKKNSYTNSFLSSYNYATTETCGYINMTFYELQPMEYDAEYFAEKFIKRIYKALGYKGYEYRNCLAQEYKTSMKYFSNQKRSLLLYDEYLKIERVDQSNEKEENQYKILLEKICNIKDNQDAIELFKNPSFVNMPISEKSHVYKIIAGNNISISMGQSKKYIKINNTEYNFYRLGDYGLLEKILIAKANNEVKMGKLLISKRDEYIFEKIKDFKLERVTRDNVYMVHHYCNLYEKYRVLSSKNKKEIGRRKK